jgi:hypothetical protein
MSTFRNFLNMLGAAALASLALAQGAAAAVDVGVGITIREPGVYGRIEIGSAPPPVLYPQPVIYAPQRVVVREQPMYLYVPPGHAKNWGKHCARYNACARPVYFVQEQWVEQQYERAHPGKRHGGGHGHGHGHGKGKDKGRD